MIKTLLLLFLSSSCALFDEVTQNGINWLGDPNHPSVAKNRNPREETPAQEDKATHILIPSMELPSKEKTATLMYNPQQVVLNLTEGHVSYREGHSVEAKADDEVFIVPVLATTVTSPQSVQLQNPQSFLEKVKGKKILQIELLLEGTGKRMYEFDLTELNHAL